MRNFRELTSEIFLRINIIFLIRQDFAFLDIYYLAKVDYDKKINKVFYRLFVSRLVFSSL
jgi:hypothetical protein